VKHTPSNIVQANEYYPFGMQTASSWTRENATDNKFLANGGTELNKTTGNYDLEFRNYDPVLARMNQVDPMAAKYASQTPYNYSFNNPVSLNDPNGADPYNHSPGTSFHGGYYTYDDIVPNKYPDVMAYNGRAGVDGTSGWLAYAGSSTFDRFNNWVNSTIHTRNVIDGISTALNSDFGGYVTSATGGFNAYRSYTEARYVGSHYVQSMDAWASIEGGKDGFLERAKPDGTVIRGGVFVDETIVERYDEAVKFLNTSETGRSIISEVNSVPGLEVWHLGAKGDAYNDKTDMISWNSYASTSFKNGAVHPASLMLMHELNHAYQNIAGRVSPSSGPNERKATRMTDRVAIELGFEPRKTYNRGDYRNTPDVNGIVPDLSKKGLFNYNMRIHGDLNEHQQKALDIFKKY